MISQEQHDRIMKWMWCIAAASSDISFFPISSSERQEARDIREEEVQNLRTFLNSITEKEGNVSG